MDLGKKEVMVIRVSKTPSWTIAEARQVISQALIPYGQVIEFDKVEKDTTGQKKKNKLRKSRTINQGEWEVQLEMLKENKTMPNSIITIEYNKVENKLRVLPPPVGAMWCSYCRYKGHNRSICRKAEPCNNCGNLGHMKRNCHANPLAKAKVQDVLRAWRIANDIPPNETDQSQTSQ